MTKKITNPHEPIPTTELHERVPSAREKRLDEKGREIVSPLPMEPPLGYKRQPTMVEIIRQQIQSEHLARDLAAQGVETFEEADDFEVGDWEEVETALLTRKIDQERVASTRVVEAAVVEEHGVGCNGTLRNGPVTCPGGGVGCPGSSDEREIREERFGPKTSEILGGPSREPPVDRTAEKIVADVSAERAPQMTEVEKDHAVENLVELLAKENAKHEALPPETKAAMERASDRVIAALEQRDRMVILTEAEFMAVAMLPALHAAGLFDVPESASSLRALFSAIQKGEIRAAGRGLFIGRVVQETEEALTLLAGFFFDDQIREEHRALVSLKCSTMNRHCQSHGVLLFSPDQLLRRRWN